VGQVLHGSATTTTAIRRAIQHSQESLRPADWRYGGSRDNTAHQEPKNSEEEMNRSRSDNGRDQTSQLQPPPYHSRAARPGRQPETRRPAVNRSATANQLGPLEYDTTTSAGICKYRFTALGSAERQPPCIHRDHTGRCRGRSVSIVQRVNPDG
jgi:hypothetical protein